MKNEKTTCSKCILSTNDDSSISISDDGICNYCKNFKEKWNKKPNPEAQQRELDAIIRKIKACKGKYNFILGLSGGTDSSFLAYWAKQNGLNPLVVHYDNGWNAPNAVLNIQNICKKLSFNLETYVNDWEEFRSMQVAYLNPGVVDIEVITDHGVSATLVKFAKKHHIKYILNGFNEATEGIMPTGWIYNKNDLINIRDILRKNGGPKKFKSFPHLTLAYKITNHIFKNQVTVLPLNYINYNKEHAKAILKTELNWIDYSGKHFENIFTKFYQAYILPTKFNIDKRKTHLSNLINSNQISRDFAKLEMEKAIYPLKEFEEDKEYVLKKLNLDEVSFLKLMQEKPKSHADYKSDIKIVQFLKKFSQI